MAFLVFYNHYFISVFTDNFLLKNLWYLQPLLHFWFYWIFTVNKSLAFTTTNSLQILLIFYCYKVFGIYNHFFILDFTNFFLLKLFGIYNHYFTSDFTEFFPLKTLWYLQPLLHRKIYWLFSVKCITIKFRNIYTKISVILTDFFYSVINQ